MTQKLEKRQKLDRAGMLVMEPTRKAMASVTEVIVIEGPAWAIPCFILS